MFYLFFLFFHTIVPYLPLLSIPLFSTIFLYNSIISSFFSIPSLFKRQYILTHNCLTSPSPFLSCRCSCSVPSVPWGVRATAGGVIRSTSALFIPVPCSSVLHYDMTCNYTMHHTVQYHMMSCHSVSYHIILCCIMSYHIFSCLLYHYMHALNCHAI